MRTILAVAVVAFVVLTSVQAQAPSIRMSGHIQILNGEGSVNDVVFQLADGSELRADKLILPPDVVRALTDTVNGREAQIAGVLHGLEGEEFALSGNVRIKLAK